MHRFYVRNKTLSVQFCIRANNSSDAASYAFALVNNDHRYSFIVTAI